ncbi:hypothetical protein H3Z83_03550 [Tenacibaculum sp. S7007]|uniref:Uncharacterized protein n=1 Tax=Tenacibaculum pelagium TaxID=2759527 RepID=A0A839AMH7_9FLAO|nr:hypothetical protein [Tenacibaculum pelagium]MBA6155598.1 hypothetical protein [Tenacibaculum pelagium]
MKKIFLLLLIVVTSTFAQKKVNNYNYVIIPNKFDFVNNIDKYQTSSLTKFLFNKNGFKAYLSNEKLPNDVAMNRCLALTAVVKDDSSMFTTKSIIELRDCYNNVIFTSSTGKSKQKEYKKAYHESIRNAFKYVAALKYKYNPSKNDLTVNKTESIPVVLETPKIINTKAIVTKKVNSDFPKTLYAQAITNGFQLVNTKPEVVFQILKTNVKDVFVIKDKNGLMYKSGNNWIAEYFNNDKRLVENYQIKF